jgi:ribosomal protein L11 methyltransferase
MSGSMVTGYRKLTYLVPEDRQDELTALLWEAGTLGIEVGEVGGEAVRLAAWFRAAGQAVAGPEPDAAPAPGEAPTAAGQGGAIAAPEPTSVPAGARLVADEVVPAADWLAPYRAAAVPFAVGERFFVDPGEPGAVAPASPPGRWLLRLPARTAFGTGSHESTRLAVELLEERPPAGLRVVDLGTGSGILAFAALLLGAGAAVAFDRDLGAALVAAGNAGLNATVLGGRRPALFAGEATALGAAARFDLALVNALPGEALPALPAVLARLAPAGEVILSGLLAAEAPVVVARLRDLGLAPRGERRSGEWVAFRFARA